MLHHPTNALEQVKLCDNEAKSSSKAKITPIYRVHFGFIAYVETSLPCGGIQ
jgi:hypothetical protein